MSIRSSYRPTRKASEKSCRPSYKWIPPHTRNGIYVKGYCAKIGNPSRRTITRQTTTTYGWHNGPVVLREVRVSETMDEENEK